MKVLWLSNCQLKAIDIASTGTWIQPIAEGLVENNNIEIAVIAHGVVDKIKRVDYKNVKQWIIPSSAKKKKNGFPSKSIVNSIQNIIDEYAPDIIHVWGVESYWGLITARDYNHIPVLLEMQGMKGLCSEYYLADLNMQNILQCFGIKEIIKRSTLYGRKKEFYRWGLYEKKIIQAHKYIDVQSEWISAQVNSIQPNSLQYSVNLPLRKPFYSAPKWIEYEIEREKKGTENNIFISSSGAVPYKGLHVAIKTLVEIRKKYPKARLRIAGDIQKKGLRQDGYSRWLIDLSKKLEVSENIDWLGSISAEKIIKELLYCGVNIVCSFVESYCLALAEPMYLGVPCVTSFTGGTSWIAKDNTNALFYSAGDAVMCAHQIARIFNDSKLRNKLSNSAREAALKRHNIDRITEKQLLIYKKVIEESLILL